MFSFFLVLSTFAAINPSRLSITSYTNTLISVEVDGNRYERLPGSLVLNDLPSGYHRVKVFEVRSERRGFRRVESFNLIYASSLMLKPMHHLSIAITPSGKIKVSEEVMRRNGRGDGRNDDRDDYGRNNQGRDNDWYDNRNNDGRGNDGRGNDGRGNDARGNDVRGNNGRDNDGRGNDGRGYNQPMSDRMFLSAKDAIRKESFDKDKLAVAKQIMSNNTLYSGQVKEMLQLFSFDDSKLDFAKYAYARTADRNNYFVVYDAFSFRKNKEELMSYIQNNRY
jgi:hypothetical protein